MLAETLRAYLDSFGDIAARQAMAARASEHGALPGAADRGAAGHVAGRSRRPRCVPGARALRGVSSFNGQLPAAPAASIRSSVAVSAIRTCGRRGGP